MTASKGTNIATEAVFVDAEGFSHACMHIGNNGVLEQWTEDMSEVERICL